MKHLLFALCSALPLLLTSCAGVHVARTDVATGATNPRSIYIRPFDVTHTVFKGWHHSSGEREIRRSLAPAEFAGILKQEMEKIAPAMVLKEDDVPLTGWLVEGDFEVIDAGQPSLRAAPGNVIGAGASHIILHVRITDLDAGGVEYSDKKEVEADETRREAVRTAKGAIVYEFDVKGGSRATGKFGSITAPGLGYAVPFDFRNAAERIAMALTPDAHRYGVRSSPTIR